MKEEKIWFQSENGLKLEGMLSINEGPSPSPGVVVCHPHPLYGGNMNNNVVMAVCQGLNKKGIVTLRFNFRGVNESEGEYSGGRGEQEDVHAAISFLLSRKEIAVEKIGVCGYSFGSMVGVPAAVENPGVKALASISPPYFSPPEILNNYTRPKLLICGTQDEFVKLTELEKLVEKLPEPKRLVVIQGADHFWWGFEQKLSENISSFFSEVLM